MDAWRFATAAEQGRAIAAGRLDPVALTEAYLDAATSHPAGSRIYARLTPARALAEAEAARIRAEGQNRRHALDGIALSWKDLFDSEGIATEAGTAMMAGRTPTEDAEVLATATQAGGICLGKTHMSEIAFSGLGYNPVMETPPNVFDGDLLPGGSSSGAAASVAFGLAAAAVGSDTGGSIRLPAAWNGLVGFKPTHGTLPLTGVVPLCVSFDTIGPITRSVEDATLVYAMLSGSKPVETQGASLAGVKLAIVEDVVMEDLEPEPAAAFDAALQVLIRAGAEVTRLSFPALREAYDLAGVLYGGESWSFWRPYVEEKGDLMFAQIRERVSAGAEVGAAQWIAAWDRLHVLRQQYGALTAGYDAVICPTAALMPPALARVAADGEYYKSTNLKALRNTRMGNLMGLCGVSVPTGARACGLLLNGAGGSDATILRLAAAAETALRSA